VLKLIQLFGLTRVEARLAARLANGQSVEEIANEFSVSLNTARTHLKSIFNKTGVRRQSELVALLLTSVLAYLANDETGEK
jgi:DNA-binding CsgD family transcriptional regulator